MIVKNYFKMNGEVSKSLGLSLTFTNIKFFQERSLLKMLAIALMIALQHVGDRSYFKEGSLFNMYAIAYKNADDRSYFEERSLFNM